MPISGKPKIGGPPHPSRRALRDSCVSGKRMCLRPPQDEADNSHRLCSRFIFSKTRPVDHRPNTYSTMALRCSLSSGVLMSLDFAAPLGPDAMAMYCLPLTSKVIGGAAKPEPTLTFHTPSSVVSS